MDAHTCDACGEPIEPSREIIVTVPADTPQGEAGRATLHFCGGQCLYDWAEGRWMYDWEHGE